MNLCEGAGLCGRVRYFCFEVQLWLYIHFRLDDSDLYSLNGKNSNRLHYCRNSFLPTSKVNWIIGKSGTRSFSVIRPLSSSFRTPYYRPPSEGWGKVIVSVCSHFGGVPDPALDGKGGVPGLRFLLGGVSQVSDFQGGGLKPQIFGGGSQVSDFWGGPGLRFWGGVPGLRFWGGVPGLRFLEGGPRSQIFGGVPGLRFLGGPGSQIFGGVSGLRFLERGGTRSQ